MKSLIAAIQFLTILPLSSTSEPDDAQFLGRSVPFFPVVGLLIGAMVAPLDYWLSFLLPIFPASVVILIIFLGISGAMHLDGLADTADGFLSSRPREKILEIMKDSRVGPMGVVAIVCVMSLKITTLAVVMPSLRWSTILLIPIAGRCAMVMMMSFLPYVRSSGGLGSVFQPYRSRYHAVWAAGFLFAGGWLAAEWLGILMGAVVLVTTFLFSLYCHQKIGGITGDTLGAACELMEMVPPLTVVIWNQAM